MKTNEEIRKQRRRMFDTAYNYYGNDSRRKKFIRLINLLVCRRLHPEFFKHPETTWEECWDWAFKEG